jgi:hypothetical protein
MEGSKGKPVRLSNIDQSGLYQSENWSYLHTGYESTHAVMRYAPYFVSQCLNVDVSSFGKSIDEAVTNLKDAVELYLKDDSVMNVFHDVGDALIGEAFVNA